MVSVRLIELKSESGSQMRQCLTQATYRLDIKSFAKARKAKVTKMGDAILVMQRHASSSSYLDLSCVAEAASCTKEGRHKRLRIWQGFLLWKRTSPHFAEYIPNCEVRQSLVQLHAAFCVSPRPTCRWYYAAIRR